MFDEVQLAPGATTVREMARLRDADVYVDVVDPMPALTGHHHRPLLVWVKAISPARDITRSYGTAATTIEAFYAALQAGDGNLAADFVIPEKTNAQPLEPRLAPPICRLANPMPPTIVTKTESRDHANYLDHLLPCLRHRMFRGGASCRKPGCTVAVHA
ncbi:hypothetical protein [Neorhizobium tomejilense]|uniref:hypothetical protein n=1 Tax=Neorhizobium tomejilense TaxID=2093828 RepID=UPI003ECD86D0